MFALSVNGLQTLLLFVFALFVQRTVPCFFCANGLRIYVRFVCKQFAKTRFSLRASAQKCARLQTVGKRTFSFIFADGV